ncbi:MAG TPA: hypothetical protein VGN20_07490 [Mucilaginibacter sp.]|jgi:hypothetical protein
MNDLYIIKKSQTGTGKTELHILLGARNYQEFLLQTGTRLDETDDTWDFAAAPHIERRDADENGTIVSRQIVHDNADVVGIKKSNTGNGTTELWFVSAAAKYKQLSFIFATALEMTDNNWSFAMGLNLDFYIIKKGSLANPTGSGNTELHILSAVSEYQEFFHYITPIEMTNEDFVFLLSINLDLFIIKKRNTGTLRTEVHILSHDSNYAEFTFQQGTALGMTDENWDFVLDSNNDLYAIFKGSEAVPTGSGKTEIHVLSADSNYMDYSNHIVTPLEMTDNRFKFMMSQDIVSTTEIWIPPTIMWP